MCNCGVCVNSQTVNERSRREQRSREGRKVAPHPPLRGVGSNSWGNSLLVGQGAQGPSGGAGAGRSRELLRDH